MLLLFWRNNVDPSELLVDPLTVYVFETPEEDQRLAYIFRVAGEDPSTQYMTQEKKNRTEYRHGGGRIVP